VDQTLELRHLWGMHHERGRGFPQVTWEQFGINQLTIVTTDTPNITRKSRSAHAHRPRGTIPFLDEAWWPWDVPSGPQPPPKFVREWEQKMLQGCTVARPASVMLVCGVPPHNSTPSAHSPGGPSIFLAIKPLSWTPQHRHCPACTSPCPEPRRQDALALQATGGFREPAGSISGIVPMVAISGIPPKPPMAALQAGEAAPRAACAHCAPSLQIRGF